MASIKEIDKAIGAHGLWKSRLKMTIESSRIDTPVETIRRDDECDFGKWLHGSTLTSSDKATKQCQAVVDLHARFHQTASRVVELALTGRKSEAETMMISGGEYAVVSDELTRAMTEWKKTSK